MFSLQVSQTWMKCSAQLPGRGKPDLTGIDGAWIHAMRIFQAQSSVFVTYSLRRLTFLSILDYFRFYNSRCHVFNIINLNQR